MGLTWQPVRAQRDALEGLDGFCHVHRHVCVDSTFKLGVQLACLSSKALGQRGCPNFARLGRSRLELWLQQPLPKLARSPRWPLRSPLHFSWRPSQPQSPSQAFLRARQAPTLGRLPTSSASSHLLQHCDCLLREPCGGQPARLSKVIPGLRRGLSARSRTARAKWAPLPPRAVFQAVGELQPGGTRPQTACEEPGSTSPRAAGLHLGSDLAAELSRRG